MWTENIRAALTELFAICALSAALDAIFDGGRAADCVRAVCGLSVALCVARLAAGIVS